MIPPPKAKAKPNRAKANKAFHRFCFGTFFLVGVRTGVYFLSFNWDGGN